jgi:hypothetical protein
MFALETALVIGFEKIRQYLGTIGMSRCSSAVAFPRTCIPCVIKNLLQTDQLGQTELILMELVDSAKNTEA